MRNTVVLTAILTAIAPLAAQGGSSLNPVIANNGPYFVTSSSTHPTTGENYNSPNSNPTGYQAAPGIPANTYVWRVYPGASNDMREPRVLTGFESVWWVSAATPDNQTVATYIPSFVVMPAVQRANAPAGALDPDFVNYYVSTPELPTTLSLPASATTHAFFAGVSFAPTPVPIIGDHALAAGYHGGDMRDTPADATTPSQGIVGTVDDGPLYDDTGATYQPDGFAVFDINASTLTPATVTYKFFDNSRTWMTYDTDNPTVNVYSNWGRRRTADPAPPLPPIDGFSDGSYYADLGTKTGTWGVEIWADPTIYANGSAALLANLGAYANQGFTLGFGGVIGTQTLEVSPFDSSLGALLPVVMLFDPNGIATSAPLTVPFSLPAAIGLYVGVEGVVADSTLTSFTTTQARYIKIAK